MLAVITYVMYAATKLFTADSAIVHRCWPCGLYVQNPLLVIIIYPSIYLTLGMYGAFTLTH